MFEELDVCPLSGLQQFSTIFQNNAHAYKFPNILRFESVTGKVLHRNPSLLI